MQDNLELYYPDGHPSAGYLNVPRIMEYAVNHDCYIVLGVGGRGTGKTYGGLDFCETRGWYMFMRNSEPMYIYLRRKQKHVNMACKPILSPFKSLNKDKHRGTTPFKIPDTDLAIIAETVEEGGKIKPTEDIHGIMASLATFCDTRSVDFSDVGVLFYDEFVPEKGERRIKNEGYTFNNIIETVNRNREFNGQPPLLVFCLANSEKLDNELFMYYKLVKPAMELRKRGDEYQLFRDKGILLIDMYKSPISQRKADTFLYSKANKDNRFSDMAINNSYDIDEGVRVRDRLQFMQYKPIVRVGELCIYRHKSKYDYQVSFKMSGSPPEYEVTSLDLSRFKQHYRYLIKALYEDRIFFDDYSAYILFDQYLKYG